MVDAGYVLDKLIGVDWPSQHGHDCTIQFTVAKYFQALLVLQNFTTHNRKMKANGNGQSITSNSCVHLFFRQRENGINNWLELDSPFFNNHILFSQKEGEGIMHTQTVQAPLSYFRIWKCRKVLLILLRIKCTSICYNKYLSVLLHCSWFWYFEIYYSKYLISL